MNNLNIFIFKHFFLSFTSLKEVKYSTSHNISIFIIIINSEVVLGEYLSLTNITRIQVFYSHKLTEIIMVTKDEDFVFTIF